MSRFANADDLARADHEASMYRFHAELSSLARTSGQHYGHFEECIKDAMATPLFDAFCADDHHRRYGDHESEDDEIYRSVGEIFIATYMKVEYHRPETLPDGREAVAKTQLLLPKTDFLDLLRDHADNLADTGEPSGKGVVLDEDARLADLFKKVATHRHAISPRDKDRPTDFERLVDFGATLWEPKMGAVDISTHARPDTITVRNLPEVTECLHDAVEPQQENALAR